MKKNLTGDISKLLNYDKNLECAIDNLKTEYKNNYNRMRNDQSWKKIVEHLNTILFM